MPRPKLKSDDEVLEAATVVLKRCGPIEFTLSGVAKEVGLSRAALIQRFTNRDTLLVRMMERGVEQVRHYLNAIPIGAGPQGLWEFLQVLVRSMNTRNDFSVNYLISWYELQVPELRTLAIQRNRAVVEGIRKRLPPGGVLGIFRPKTTKCSGGPAVCGLQRGITFFEIPIWALFE
ncbi:TetR/AcrR family transcriptional regulator [Klebsiella pneumoniae]|uniref:TetR/AcrR family transcriptional regulator n=1 Tax=Klebsiella pneumoniae TaxID=573 RepID=UPI0029F5B7F3|nr:TetR family transcriptional regulator [Klebsiella pneumoniae]